MQLLNVKDTSLILEGGSFRTVYTAGILDAFLDHEIMMPYILGVSAGAISACSYISEQKERTFRVIADYRHDKRYMGFRNFIKERSLFGLNFAYDVIPNQLNLFDWEKFKSYEGSVQFGVTNAKTGQVEYKNALEMDRSCTLLRATCAIPVMFPEIKLEEEAYFDGGLAEPIPINKAESDGFEKHVLILTRPKGYRKHTDRQSKFTMKLLSTRYPKLVETMKRRVIRYNETIRYIEKLEEQGKVFVFRPEQAIQSLEKDVNVMRKNYEFGYKHAIEKMDELKQFLNN
ncbi:patatin-like phospholipase family protein [Ureibacillus manganicus]|uniref:Phospholipase n=1 Tax=Ureibacillus manganicus DSM 26584 TaxID=1384049 RepID=A0A0A3I2D4_9BACL|nr:patatin family protein [Ureibacillus manganicus]KGR78864.1 phospholipase [Ureibacillus manganicus DSM 26584]